MTQALQVASLDAFRPADVLVQLPSQQGSNEAVRLRRPDLVGLMAAGDGDVPDILTNMVAEMLNSNGKAKQQSAQITAENLPQVMQSVDVVAIAAFVEPKLTRATEPHDGCVPVTWLSFADKVFVFGWALGGEQAAGAQRFPAQPAGGAGAVPKKQGVSPAAKRGAGNRR